MPRPDQPFRVHMKSGDERLFAFEYPPRIRTNSFQRLCHPEAPHRLGQCMSRELVLDTETTGLDPKDGHRVIELACVELINFIPTGASWHWYFNPQRDVPKAATDVHGLTAQFLADKPLFGDMAQEILDALGDARLIIHNAPFDMGFLNHEFGRLGLRAAELRPRHRHAGAGEAQTPRQSE